MNQLRLAWFVIVVLAATGLPCMAAGGVSVASITMNNRASIVTLSVPGSVSKVEASASHVVMQGRVLRRSKDGHWQVVSTIWKPILQTKEEFDKLSKRSTGRYELERRKVCNIEIGVIRNDKAEITSLKVVLCGSRYRVFSRGKHGKYSTAEPRPKKGESVESDITRVVPSEVELYFKNELLLSGPMPRL